MLATMNPPRPLPPPVAPPRHNAARELWLQERASLDGLECSEVGWDEWDASVSAQDEAEALPH